jgi:hypothetical protein
VLFWLAASLAAGPDTGAGEPGGRTDFNFDIRPLLSDRCFRCHGPDEGARKRKLRLDVREVALGRLESGRVPIVPGKPAESEVYLRITAGDASKRMPPADSNLSLSPAEIDLIRRWIEDGAEYRRHWAFIPVGDPQVPKPRDGTTARNPIDLFVLDRLEKEGLAPAPEASREALIRRASLDLTGLPPSAGEIDAFLADGSPDAYEKVVDRLLASPAYGEARAAEWLDLARYADTYGYQSDVDRDMSPWRDWVIRAFNENLRHDEFIAWQLAGDLLPSPSRDQVLATAFLRLHRQTNEGGSIEEEFRTEYVSDRVHTTGTAFLGLTLECARCHDHKFDPIAQRDYYRLFAFFQNIDESGLYSHFTRATPTPTLALYPDGAEAKHAGARGRIADAENALREAEGSAAARFEEWIRPGPPGTPTTLPETPTILPEVRAPAAVDSFPFDEAAGGSTPNAADPARPGLLADGPELVPGKEGNAIRFSGDNSIVLKGSGAFHRTSPFSFVLWIRPAARQERAVVFHRSRAWTDSGSRGYELLLEDGKPSFALVHFWPGNAVRVRARDALPTGEWTRLAITYDGSSRADGIRLHAGGERMAVDVVRDCLTRDITHRGEWGDADAGAVELTLAGRFRDSGLKGGLIDGFLVFDRRLSEVEVRTLAGKSAAVERETLLAHFRERIDRECVARRDDLRRAREEEARLADEVPEIMVMREMAERRPARVLRRGAYDAPGDEVEPGTPDGIFPFPETLPRNRLGLARWLTDRRNPLTARVVVNRAWQVHLGRGIVTTPEDFGSQGRLPSHPALLDWLAATFMDGGWDLKGLHRLIVTSAAYRRSSRGSADSLARDAENVLLSRGPRHRLRAEVIRDGALFASGLLSPRIGGPSVKPYQPPGLWEEAGTGKSYVEDKGEGLYRRSLYTFWRRTSPPPSMAVFDAPTREVCIARRDATTTPLQALVILNDPQFVEAARVLGERLVKEYPRDVGARIDAGFRAVVGRRPEAEERALLEKLYHEERRIFDADLDAARRSLRVGERPPDASLPPADAAATAVLASALMNLDEFVMKR